MKHLIKTTRVIIGGKWHKGPVTTAAVLDQIPVSVIMDCPSRIIIDVANAINTAYHTGKAAAGAEVIDDCVWIDAVGKLIPIASLQAIKLDECAGGRKLTMDYDDVYNPDEYVRA